MKIIESVLCILNWDINFISSTRKSSFKLSPSNPVIFLLIFRRSKSFSTSFVIFHYPRLGEGKSQ